MNPTTTINYNGTAVVLTRHLDDERSMGGGRNRAYTAATADVRRGGDLGWLYREIRDTNNPAFGWTAHGKTFASRTEAIAHLVERAGRRRFHLRRRAEAAYLKGTS